MRIYILLLFLLASCATRKVDINKTETKKDSLVETKVTTSLIEVKQKTDSTNIVINADSSETVITPIDSSKTIIVEGKTYKNVVLRIKKNKHNTTYQNKKIESNIKQKDSTAIIKTETKETVVDKSKNIDNKPNYWTLFYWVILLLIIYVLYKNRKSVFDIL